MYGHEKVELQQEASATASSRRGCGPESLQESGKRVRQRFGCAEGAWMLSAAASGVEISLRPGNNVHNCFVL
jgi:hypothetical protein